VKLSIHHVKLGCSPTAEAKGRRKHMLFLLSIKVLGRPFSLAGKRSFNLALDKECGLSPRAFERALVLEEKAV
jgi:hypothetical protein